MTTTKMPKVYGYTGRYSCTKSRAELRAKLAREAGLTVKVKKGKSKKSGKTGYLLLAKTTPTGRVFKRRR